MLHSRLLLEERGKLRRISTYTECDSTEVQTGYVPITSLYVFLSRIHFSEVKYRMQYNSHKPPL